MVGLLDWIYRRLSTLGCGVGPLARFRAGPVPVPRPKRLRSRVIVEDETPLLFVSILSISFPAALRNLHQHLFKLKIQLFPCDEGKIYKLPRNEDQQMMNCCYVSLKTSKTIAETPSKNWGPLKI